MRNVYYQRKALAEDKKSKKVISDVLAIIDTAERLGIKARRVPYTELVSLAYQGQQQLIYHRTSPQNTATAAICCQNKKITRNLLVQAGLSVPVGYLVKDTDKEDYLLEVFQALKKPVVVKAIDGSEAKCVTTNITDQDRYLKALKESFAYDRRSQDKRALVETMFDGKEYRILANKEKVVSIIERLPANVIGDGQHSIEHLIGLKNQDSKRGNSDEDLPLFKIDIDQELKDFLAKQQLQLSSVPKEKQQVWLRPHSSLNISKGGDTIDVTNQVHPSVKTIALKAIAAIPGLAWTGIDFMTKNIRAQQQPDEYAILEMNSSPRLIWQAQPFAGQRQLVVEEFLKTVFPSLII